MVFFWRGEWQEARDCVAGSERLWHAPEGGIVWGTEFLYECYLGNVDAARALLSQAEEHLPTTDAVTGVGRWEALMAVIEGLSVMGFEDEVAEHYPLALAALSTGTVVTHLGRRLLETVAGIAAAAGQRWQLAEPSLPTKPPAP